MISILVTARRTASALLVAGAVVVVAGCGDSDSGPDTVQPAAKAERPLSAVDARDLLERRLGRDRGFGCALLPQAGTVEVVAKDAATLNKARRLIPDLLPGRRLKLVTDAGAESFADVQRALLGLRSSAPEAIVANLETTVDATRCPRILVDVPRGRVLSRAERRFLDDARTRYGTLVRVERTMPGSLD